MSQNMTDQVLLFQKEERRNMHLIRVTYVTVEFWYAVSVVFSVVLSSSVLTTVDVCHEVRVWLLDSPGAVTVAVLQEVTVRALESQ